MIENTASAQGPHMNWRLYHDRLVGWFATSREMPVQSAHAHTYSALVKEIERLTAQETPTRQRQDRNGLGPKDGGSVGNADAPERNPA